IATDLSHHALPLFTAACDVILCTSETEGWPNCVKEALACNVPFVSTDVSDLADIARNDRFCRIGPDDPAILAETICEVLALSEKPNVRRHVESMSVDTLSNRLIELYRSLLEAS